MQIISGCDQYYSWQMAMVDSGLCVILLDLSLHNVFTVLRAMGSIGTTRGLLNVLLTTHGQSTDKMTLKTATVFVMPDKVHSSFHSTPTTYSKLYSNNGTDPTEYGGSRYF